jgi:hypothetical protein
MNLGKKVKIFGKQIPIAAIALLAIAGLASAGLLSYYGIIKGTATISQSVKLDGKSCTGTQGEGCTVNETIPESVPGGECFCFQHSLKNDASVPAKVSFTTTGTPDLNGISVKFLEKEHIIITPEMFSQWGTTDQFNSTVHMDWECDKVVWTIDLAEIPDHWSTGVQLVINDGTNVWEVGWSPGESTTSPIYKYWTGSGWSAKSTTLPDGVTVSGNYNGEHYEISVPIKYLNRCGGTFYWAINTEASWDGHSASVQNMYPKNWGRWSDPTSNMTTNNVGTALANPLTLASKEEKHFCSCYDFAINIKPDTYTITTGIVPVTQP